MTPRLASRTGAAVRAGSRRTSLVAVWVAAIVAAAIALVLLSSLLARPDHVPELEVRNPHEWHATVAVSSPGEGSVGLGRVTRQSDRTFHDVLDQGDVWIVRFTYAGVEATVQVTRSDLEAAGWSLEVPSDLGDAAGAAGLAPSDQDG
jgi:hypothetical protein